MNSFEMEGAVPFEGAAAEEAKRVVIRMSWVEVTPHLFYNYASQNFLAVNGATLYVKLEGDQMVVLPCDGSAAARCQYNKLKKEILAK